MAFVKGEKVLVLKSTDCDGNPDTTSQWTVDQVGTVTDTSNGDSDFPYDVEFDHNGEKEKIVFRESDLAHLPFFDEYAKWSAPSESRLSLDYNLDMIKKIFNDTYKEKSTMSSSTKYYKTIKDLPTIEEGAILEQTYDGDYTVIDDLFLKENHPEGKEVKITDWNVEGSPDFYVRVYKLKNGTYGTRDQARTELTASVTPQE